MNAAQPGRSSRHRSGPMGLMKALVIAASLAACSCVSQGPEDIRSLTYDFTAEHRLAAERGASQDMQDSCYFSGYQYFRPEGPPRTVSEGADVRATQSFTCVGTAAGP